MIVLTILSTYIYIGTSLHVHTIVFTVRVHAQIRTRVHLCVIYYIIEYKSMQNNLQKKNKQRTHRLHFVDPPPSAE